MDKIYQKSFFGGKNAGFTLIELLVVVLIIGILAAVAFPQYEKAVMKARVTEAMEILRKMADNVDMCMLANGGSIADCGNTDTVMEGFEGLLNENGVPETKNFTYGWLAAPIAMDKEDNYGLVVISSTINQSGEVDHTAIPSTGRWCMTQTDKGLSFCRNLSNGQSPSTIQGTDYYPF